jgi:hypothetical protein
LWPGIAKVFPAGQWIFQDDHAPPHVLRLTMNWKQANNITTMMWPAQSPDVKIIENFWEMDKYFTARLRNNVLINRNLLLPEVSPLLPVSSLKEKSLPSLI